MGFVLNIMSIKMLRMHFLVGFLKLVKGIVILISQSIQISAFNKDGVEFSNKVFVGLNSQNKLIVLSASTLAGKMTHIQPQLNRMWGSIRFLNRMSNQQ